MKVLQRATAQRANFNPGKLAGASWSPPPLSSILEPLQRQFGDCDHGALDF